MMGPQYRPLITQSDADAVRDQVASGWVGCGETTRKWEETIASIEDPGSFAIATTSGTVALMVALEALHIPKDSSVLFPAYAMLAGANAAKFLGYRVWLVDIDPETLCMDLNKMEESLKSKHPPKAVIFVDHNAYTGKDRIRAREICNSTGVQMIEDAAQCFGCGEKKWAGSISTFSFSVPKMITTGQGGAMLTRNPVLAERMRKLVDHGGGDWRKTKIHTSLGVNFKFNDISAALGISQCSRLHEIRAAKRKIINLYEENGVKILGSGASLPWMMCARFENPERIISNLHAAGYQAVMYYKEMTQHKEFVSLRYFPVAKRAAESVLYLPSSLDLSADKIKEICAVIKETK